MRFADLGDPTRREIDRLVKLLLGYRKRGQFFNIWPQGGDPVEWMRAEKVVVSAMYAAQIARSSPSALPFARPPPVKATAPSPDCSPSRARFRDSATARCLLPATSTGGTRASPAPSCSVRAITTQSRPRAGDSCVQASTPTGSREARGPDLSDSGRRRLGCDRPHPRRRTVGQAACRISSWNSTPRQQRHFLERWERVHLDLLLAWTVTQTPPSPTAIDSRMGPTGIVATTLPLSGSICATVSAP